ncbi:hypothetical protein [Haladaptatus caseinilyticus]|uniref:hypothetical protein n=1 Tax=Haladaptatus caseinilyticus TaxID=2993314 RepID=UPI00224B0297|nr:hypothetical protein [Haladaptatus caseinilyticus]
MTDRERASFTAICPDCNERKGTETPNEILGFYRRHRNLTGHDIEWEFVDHESIPTSAANEGLKAIVLELDETFDNGVPLALVTAAMGEQGYSIGETMAELRELRMTGHVWEPKDDHVSAF